ncbi:hypothetical protein LUZ61_009326 [Rhynchospora tenuis]|uniref:EGF-like domain-containing protein n=1 Tax=Rhynchospora tenuis TaxID=198213 RepID=A0AAD5ZWZ7_9POAL|nr:hypothetical protein LUZ61_009326 [Rhynchospora tenuis]
MRILVVYLLLLQGASSFSWIMQGVKADLLSPYLDGVCNSMVCGKGTCKVAQGSRFGFECECDPGWARFWSNNQFAFLPCVIPQCIYDSVCYNDTIARASTFPEIPHSSLFDPCLWSFCGQGTCTKMSDFEHRCECNEGYNNLLNMSNLPCFKECKVSADCPFLGFTISNSTTPSPPNHLEQTGNAITTKLRLQWIYTWTILVVLQLPFIY